MPPSSTPMGIRRPPHLEREACLILPSTRMSRGGDATSSGMGTWGKTGRIPQQQERCLGGSSGTNRPSRPRWPTTNGGFTSKTDPGRDSAGSLTMPCPVCKRSVESGSDHRPCIFTLFADNTIQSIEEWDALATRPVTIVKGRVRVRLPLTSNETSGGNAAHRGSS